jgi:hypothetical protein
MDQTMRRLLLGLSVLLNLVLLLVIGWRLRHDSNSSIGEASPLSPGVAINRQTGSPAATADAQAKVSPGTNAPFHWTQLDRSTWFTYRDSLLQIGCPKRSVREIMEPLLDREMDAKVRDLILPYQRLFWEVSAQTPTNGWHQLEEVGQRIAQEYTALKEGLFAGFPDLKEPSDGTDGDSRLAHLPEGLAERAAEAVALYNQQMADLTNPPHPPEEQRRLKHELRERLDNELKSFLSDDEFLQVELGMGGTYSQSPDMAGFWEALSLNREELRGVSEIQARHRVEPDTPVDSTEAEGERAEIAKLLGPAKAAEWERAADPTYQSMVQLTSRLEAPLSAAAALSEAQQKALEARDAIRSLPDLSPAERQQRLDALKQETIHQAATILGSNRGRLTWERFQKSWLETTFQIPFQDILGPAASGPP